MDFPSDEIAMVFRDAIGTELTISQRGAWQAVPEPAMPHLWHLAAAITILRLEAIARKQARGIRARRRGARCL